MPSARTPNEQRTPLDPDSPDSVRLSMDEATQLGLDLLLTARLEKHRLPRDFAVSFDKSHSLGVSRQGARRMVKHIVMLRLKDSAHGQDKATNARLIKEKKYEKFYMHGLGHMLGIDVHDVGRYYFGKESRALEPGVVMTVEPGLYIAPDTKDIPEKYLGIGVRIEDDVLCTNNGPRVLTSKVPKHAEEIETLMNRG